MSQGERIPWDEAYEIAREVSNVLTPVVVRSKCVGSVRRRRAHVGDIEFLVEPHMQADLFGRDPLPIMGELNARVLELGTFVRGGSRYMKVTNLLGHDGLGLDVFVCWPPAEWGSLLAIRTGPAELGAEAMRRMKASGILHREGHVEGHPTPTEEDFFTLAGLRCVPPAQRDAYVAELVRERASV